MTTLNILSGGAAQGLVSQLEGQFFAEAGRAIQGSYGAVGAMRDKLLAGEPCDVLILTQALIEQLSTSGHVRPGSAQALGVVKTGIALKTGAQAMPVDTPAALKTALRAATGIYFPDPQKATAGIHFMNVLKTLGLTDELAPRLRVFPNGATAMRAMAQSSESGLVGCTQVTEILYTQGVQLIALLPKEFELATIYTAAVCSQTEQPQAAAMLIDMLAGPQAQALRRSGGFE